MTPNNPDTLTDHELFDLVVKTDADLFNQGWTSSGGTWKCPAA